MFTFGGLILLVILGAIAVLLPAPVDYDGVAEVATGHVALEADNLGVALYHYKRALTVIPRDPSVQLGVAIVRALRTDILPEESGLWPDMSRLTADVMSVNELCWLSLILWTATFSVGAVWAVRRPDTRLRRAMLILGGITIILLGLLVVRQGYEMSYPAAVVTEFEALAYAAPDENAPILFKLYSGAEGRIWERRKGWERLYLPDGREGWLLESTVRVEIPLETEER
jgi:hypothetical protein